MGRPFELMVPPHELRWYHAGEHCDDPSPADMLLVDHGTAAAAVIRAGQWLIARTTQPALVNFTWLDHCAVIRPGPDGPTVSEMGPAGHELRPLHGYVDRTYCVVHFDVGDRARQRALAYDRACWSADYGWLQPFAHVAAGLGVLRLGVGNTQLICSSHVSSVMKALGLFADRPDGEVLPMHLAWYVDAKNPA